MKKTLTFAVIAASFAAGSAFAADLPSKKSAAAAPVVVSPWDFNVGAGITTDYISRGISQSSHHASVNATAELNYKLNDTFQAYVQADSESVTQGAANGTTMELDLLGGVRSTFGNFSVDTGVQWYVYPGYINTTAGAPGINYYEVYVMPSYNITDAFTVGLKDYYSPNYTGMKATGNYLAGTAKYTLPIGISLSGEFGREYLGTAGKMGSLGNNASLSLVSYNAYNIGASYAYKFATLDLRYYGSSLNSKDCGTDTGASTSNLCDKRVVGTLSFAFTSKDIK
jgi:uncharacterized protein (TIGR02001 family)